MVTHCKLLMLSVFHWVSPQTTQSLLSSFKLYMHGKIQPSLVTFNNRGVITDFGEG